MVPGEKLGTRLREHVSTDEMLYRRELGTCAHAQRMLATTDIICCEKSADHIGACQDSGIRQFKPDQHRSRISLRHTWTYGSRNRREMNRLVFVKERRRPRVQQSDQVAGDYCRVPED